MLFKSNAPLSAAAMNARLLAMAKEQGRDVYAVETLGGELAPRLLYLVHPDGSRQLVRGAVFDELDNRSLRSDIVAAGDDEYVSNSLGAVPGDDHRAKPSVRRHRRQARHRRAAEAALLRAARAGTIHRAETLKVSRLNDDPGVVRRLFAICSFPPLPSPPGGGWARKLIVMWRPQGKIT